MQSETVDCEFFNGSYNRIGVCEPDLAKFDIHDSSYDRSALAYVILHEASHSLIGDIGNPHVDPILKWAPKALETSEEFVFENIGLKAHINVDGFASKLLNELGYNINGISHLFAKSCKILGDICDRQIKKSFMIREHYALLSYKEGWGNWQHYFKIIPVCDNGFVFNYLTKNNLLLISKKLGASCISYDKDIIEKALRQSFFSN